ncbi:trypsin [Tribolium castaneum]|nr:PREDICTED: trypsin isoform X1 [Tribolium castaneum]|eukprot:XP_008196898.2 PREDICTED: trypsin isoform X1 [Tribolium castaneum]
MLAMLQLLCFSAVILSASPQFLPLNDAMERIIYGTVVDISDFPYQVALVSRRNNRKRIICGGALVKPRVVFTAAHCTHTRNDEERENLSVLVGANHVNDPDGVFHEIDTVMKHPDFSYHELDNDFSVITLKEPVEYSDKARSIDISNADHDGGTVATISGWGRTEYGTPSKYLRATKLTVENWDKCQDYFPGVFHPKITRNMICVRPSRTTTYFGDSGGPLVVDGKLIGLVSFGRKVGGEKKTTVFTRVRNFLDFVEEVVPGF